MQVILKYFTKLSHVYAIFRQVRKIAKNDL